MKTSPFNDLQECREASGEWRLDMVDRAEREITAPVHFRLRNAAEFIRCAHRFKSDVTLQYEGHHIDGKSMLNLMSFPIQKGRSFQIQVKGSDAETCLYALEESVRSMQEWVPSEPSEIET